MKQCPKCGKSLPDAAKFCDVCGTPTPVAPAAPVCHACGGPLTPGIAFCPRCGAPAAVEYSAAPAAPAAPVAPAAEKAKSGFSTLVEKVKTIKKPYLIGGVAGVLALVLIIILVCTLTAGGSKDSAYNGKPFALYLKEDQIYFSNLSKKPVEITSDFGDISDWVSSYSEIARKLTKISNDGKRIFFPDRVGEFSDGATLYWQYLSKKGDAQKIDSGISAYYLSGNGKLVTYLKDGNTIYQHDLKEKTKIASDVDQFYVSEDGKTIYYLTDEDALYRKVAGKDKEKLDSDVSSVVNVSENFKTVTYLKDGVLYVRSLKGDKVKIASDVTEVVAVYESGHIYYISEKEAPITYMDLFTDDVDTSGMDEYDLDNLKNMKDNLEDMTLYGSNTDLYYYNGKDSVLVASGAKTTRSAYDKDVVYYTICDYSSIGSLRLSDLIHEEEGWGDDTYYSFNTYEAYDMVEELLSGDDLYKGFVAIGSKATELKLDEIPTLIRISNDGKQLYYITDVDDEAGDLYKVTIGKKVSEPVKVDTDVYTGSFYFLDNGKLAYYKDYSDKHGGELYINGKKIEADVEGISYDKDSGKLLIKTDYDNENNYTLKVYDGKKVTKVSDDVHTTVFTNGGQILYITDYSAKRSTGDLYLYKGGKKSAKIDEDVYGILYCR